MPWDAAWRITQLFGGDVRFVLASSGHIAGIINPPGGKGNYWTREIKDAEASSPEQWLQSATKHEGSWWPDWSAWLSARSGEKGQAAVGRQQEAPAAGGCAGDLRLGKVEWLGGAEAGCLQALAKAGTNSPVRARTPRSHFFRVAREGLVR